MNNWVVELRREIGGTEIPQPLYLRAGTPTQMAQRVINADDMGAIGIGTAWTEDIKEAGFFNETGAKQTAEALDRCCQGCAVAAPVDSQPAPK